MLGKPGHDPAGEQLVLRGRVDDHVAVARPDHGDVVDAAARCAGTGRRPRCRSGRASRTCGAVPSSRASRWTNWYLRLAELRRAAAGRSSLFSSGLGSNVSRWLGPPAMNRKMTDLRLRRRQVRRPRRERVGVRLVLERRQGEAAEAAEGVAEKGSTATILASGHASCGAAPSPPPLVLQRLSRSRSPRPVPTRRPRRSRRLRAPSLIGSALSLMPVPPSRSFNIQKAVQVKHCQPKLAQRLLLQKRTCQ